MSASIRIDFTLKYSLEINSVVAKLCAWQTYLSQSLSLFLSCVLQEVTELDPQIVKSFLLSHSYPQGGGEKPDDITLLVDLFMELLQCSPVSTLPDSSLPNAPFPKQS